MLPLRDHNQSAKFPFITLLLIAANVYVFYLELTAPNLDAFVTSYGVVPTAINLGTPATLLPFLTSMFLHAGWFHLLANMWFLWIFGDNVEDRLGKLKYLLLYLAAGILAATAQYAISPQSSIPMIGASGAVAGVLGAYILFFPTHRIDTLIPIFFFIQIIRLPALVVIGLWFLTQLLAGLGSLGVPASANTGGVAFFAHIGGFIAGLVLGLMLKPPKPS